MSIITASVLGLAAVLLAVQFKSKGGEYGTYLIMAAGLILFFYGTGKMQIIIDTAHQIQSYIHINSVYLTIEIFAKLSILAVSMPVLLALLETLRDFLA